MTQVIDTGSPQLLARIEDRVGWVIFNNPERHNALTPSMFDAIPRVVSLLADGDARVVVMRGSGDRAFVSGADISQFGETRTNVEDRKEFDRLGRTMMDSWSRLSVPLVAMIRGWCLGGGLLLALRADIRICDSHSRLGIPVARLGAGYRPESVEALVAEVGSGWAAEMLFTGRHLDADLAERIGLVNRAVAPDRLDAEIRELTGAIVANAPLTIAGCKAALAVSSSDRDESTRSALDEAYERCFRSEDYIEGQRVFREKREPWFIGR